MKAKKAICSDATQRSSLNSFLIFKSEFETLASYTEPHHVMRSVLSECHLKLSCLKLGQPAQPPVNCKQILLTEQMLMPSYVNGQCYEKHQSSTALEPLRMKYSTT